MIDEIDGLPELLAACKKIEKDAAKKVRAAIAPIMEEIAEEARAAAPVDTGALRKSFGVKTKMIRGVIVFSIAGVAVEQYATDKGMKAPYWTYHFVSGGTKYTKKAPDKFFEEIKKKYQPIIDKAIDDTMAEIEKEIP